MNPAEHLGSARNLELLMGNVNARAGYIERLEAALRCWKAREDRKAEEARP